MTIGLKSEVFKLMLNTLLVLALGQLIGFPIISLLIAGAIYLYIGSRKVSILFQWVNSESAYPPSELQGIWSEIAEAIYKDRRKLTKIQSRQEQELERVTKIASSMQDGIVILKDHTIIDWWNPKAAKMLHLTSKDRFKPLSNRVRHPDFQRYLTESNFSKPCTFSPTSEYNKTYEVHVNNVTPELGELLVIFRDVSEIKRLEQMRKDFVGNISHELRTPLTVVNGYIDMMESMLEEQPWHKILGQMRNQSERMTALTADLTMLSKLEADNYQPRRETIDINTLVATVIEDASHLTESVHTLRNNSIEGQIEIQGDYQQMYSAISNLVVNAIRHNPEGCDIEVDTKATETKLIIRVQDNGKGIAKRHLSRLTERFYRTDTDRNSATGGTGLGLAIVKHVLQHHNGKLMVDSEESVGTIFEIHLGR